MRTFAAVRGTGKTKVEAQVVCPGTHIAVVIGGGDTAHIGAVAVAFPRPSLKKDGSISASCSVICGLGHKDDEVARKMALELASCFRTTVCVSAGLHMDDPSPDDFILLMQNLADLQNEIKKQL